MVKSVKNIVWKRLLAVFTLFVLILQGFQLNVVQAEGAGSSCVTSTKIFYDGNEIQEGMEVSPDVNFQVRYEFSVPNEEAEYVLPVPRYLEVADMGETDVIIENMGAPYKVGTVRAENGVITFKTVLNTDNAITNVFSSMIQEDGKQNPKDNNDNIDGNEGENGPNPIGGEGQNSMPSEENKEENGITSGGNEEETVIPEENSEENSNTSEGSDDKSGTILGGEGEFGNSTDAEEVDAEGDSSVILSAASPVRFASLPVTAKGTIVVNCTLDRTAIAKAETFTLVSGGRNIQVNLKSNLTSGNEMNDFIESAQLRRLFGDGTCEQIEDDAEISFSDNLQLYITFSITAEQGAQIKDKQEYDISLPQGLQCRNLNLEIPLSGNFQGVVKQFGICFVRDGRAYVVFIDNFYQECGGINGGYVEIKCKLDREAIGGAERYTLVLFEESSLSITVKDNIKTCIELEKKGSYDKNTMRFHWIVIYKPGNQEQSSRKLVDTFSKAEQVYIANSFKIGGKAVTPDIVPENDGESWVITYNLPNNIPESGIKIEYDTTAADELLQKYLSGQVSGVTKIYNHAGVKNDEEISLGNAEAFAEFPGANFEFLVKDGKKAYTDTKELNWTVTVKTYDRNLKNLTVYDMLPEGLELNAESLRINNKPLSELAGYQLITEEESLKNDSDAERAGDKASFAVKFPDDLTESEYVITYTTDIVNTDIYEGADTNHEFKNKAWLGFQWYGNGTGEIIQYIPPTVEKGISADVHLIRKGGEYNRQTHEITWTVTVNPWNVDIKDGIFTDIVPLGQTYVDGSFECAQEGKITFGGWDSEKRELTFTAGEIGKETVSFAFRTAVDNKDDYAYNSTKDKNGGKIISYSNVVHISANVLFTGALTATEVTDSASAFENVISEILKKEAVSYNWTTHEIEWRVTVNQNKMPMPDAVLTDIVPLGQSYVTGSATLNGTGISENLIANNESAEETTVVFNLENRANNNTVVLEYRTKVDVDYAGNKFAGDKTISMKNSISLSRKDYDIQSVTAEEIITDNLLLDKTADKQNLQSKGFVDYTVKINKSGLDYTLGGTIDKAELKDTFSRGLLLDIDSVTLCEASVAADGTFVEGNDVNLDGRMENHPSQEADPYFVITLPKDTAVKSFVLKYRLYVIDTGIKKLDNHVEFLGFIQDSQSGDQSLIFQGSGSGGGSFEWDDRGSIEIQKTDEYTKKPLAGVTFEIKTAKGQLAGSGITDAAGKLKFDALKFGNYIITETQPLEGYKAIPPQTVTVDASKKAVIKEIKNERNTGEITLSKVNDLGYPVDGAVFEVTDAESLQKVAVAVSVAGEANFGYFPYGTYNIKETEAPKYHLLNTDVLTATIDKSGNLVSIVNSKGEEVTQLVNICQKASVKIVKVDSSGGRPMRDVVFTIFDSRGNECGKGATDDAGILIFEPLMVGETYTIQETTPRGYYDSADKTVTLNSEEETVIHWENTKKPDTGGGSHPGNSGTPVKPDKPSDLNKPEDTEKDKPSEPNMPENTEQDRPSELEKPSEKDPSVEMEEEEKFMPEMPEEPVYKGHVVKSDDGVYYIIDDNDVPLAYFDMETEEWIEIEDNEIPLGTIELKPELTGDLPRTGDERQGVLWFGISVVSALCFILLVKRKEI